jgi:hypothetical protein
MVLFYYVCVLLDCFSRGLLREALGQLAGLKRRKLALEMLGAAVQAGLDRRYATTTNDISNKRKLNDDGSVKKTTATPSTAPQKDTLHNNTNELQTPTTSLQEEDKEAGPPAAKKARTET